MSSRPTARQYHEFDDTVEMFDKGTGKVFLKRCEPTESIKLADFYKNGYVTVFARRLKVVEYANEFTRRKFAASRTTTLLIVKPDAYRNFGKILSVLYDNDFSVGRVRMGVLSRPQAEKVLADQRSQRSYRDNVGLMSSDAVVAIELVGADCVNRLHAVAGPADPVVAAEVAPKSMRALFGTDACRNAVYVAQTAEEATRNTRLFFESGEVRSPAKYDNCALFVIKPHSVKAQKAGDIVQELLDADFEISALQTFSLDRHDSQDYLEVYKGVVPEYAGWLEELASGVCMVLQVRGDDIVARLREFVGPYHPEIAQTLRPETLRARYGADSVRNAVHCTELPHDGPLETKFFFHVLAQRV